MVTYMAVETAEAMRKEALKDDLKGRVVIATPDLTGVVCKKI